jgi:hypothetical protein
MAVECIYALYNRKNTLVQGRSGTHAMPDDDNGDLCGGRALADSHVKHHDICNHENITLDPPMICFE